MSKEKATAHFLGRPGHHKLNCGQAVINAFKEKFSLPDALVAEFSRYGGGNAPQGYCGSLYAAKVILSGRDPEKLRECEGSFVAHAGSTKCSDIRSAKRLTCLGCVEKAAACLESV